MILVTMFVAACGNNGTLSSDLLPEPNGQYVQRSDDYAYAVAVYAPQSSGICSGTRIAENKILTASHCTERSGTYVVRNADFYAQGTQVRRLGEGNVGDPNDLAIITLSSISRDDAPDSKQRIARIGVAGVIGETLRLTGVGCDDVESRTGIGQMRTGQNVLYERSDLLKFLTPYASAHRVAGSDNRASSCAGDSGGGWVRQTANGDELVGVVHAGGSDGENQESLAVDINNEDNIAFLESNGIDVR